MKQRQRPNTVDEKFTECKSILQCIDLDPSLPDGPVSIFKILCNLSKEGRKHVQISYDALAFMARLSPRTVITHVRMLEELGYISKVYVGGSNSHDCNQYKVGIPQFYYEWLKPSKKVSKFSPQQQIAMAKVTLIKLGAVGENELNHAIQQTKLKPVYDVMENSTGLKRMKAKATINNTLKKFNEKNNVEFPTAF